MLSAKCKWSVRLGSLIFLAACFSVVSNLAFLRRHHLNCCDKDGGGTVASSTSNQNTANNEEDNVRLHLELLLHKQSESLSKEIESVKSDMDSLRKQLEQTETKLEQDQVAAKSATATTTSTTRSTTSSTRPAAQPTPKPKPKPKQDPEQLLQAEVIQREQREHKVERIYYINLEKNVQRRTSMEAQLRNQSIPFVRVPASIGETNNSACIERNRVPEGNCKGVSGLAKSNLDIIDHYNTTGLTLVFEDDIKIVDLQNLQQLVDETLQRVPEDWDIIRWDCNEDVVPWMDYYNKQKTVFRTVFERECILKDPNQKWPLCRYCGGTFAMLWRGSSVHKLRDVSSTLPYSDIDCRLTTPALKSYCVRRVQQSQFWKGKDYYFIHAPPVGERSDIPQKQHAWFYPELRNRTKANKKNKTQTIKMR